MRLKALVKALLWSDVQDGEWSGEELCVALQVEVEEAVAFQLVAAGAQCVFTDSSTVAIWEELSVAAAVNGVRKSGTHVEQRAQDTNEGAHSD